MEETPYREMWVETEDGQSLCALINGDLGWLMYLRENGDAAFRSRNPDYMRPAAAVLDYRLGNGQADEYPLEWALPVERVLGAIDYFGREKKPPLFIVWHNHSGDGADITRDTPGSVI